METYDTIYYTLVIEANLHSLKIGWFVRSVDKFLGFNHFTYVSTLKKQIQIIISITTCIFVKYSMSVNW